MRSGQWLGHLRVEKGGFLGDIFQDGVDDGQGFFLGEGGLLLADEMWFFAFHVQEGLEGAWFRFKRVWRLSWGAPGGGNGVLSFYARGQCPVLVRKIGWLSNWACFSL